MDKKYAAIIDMPHHVSETRERMSMRDRAGQFAPFAALTGYDAIIKESARLTGTKLEQADHAIEELDRSIRALLELPKEERRARVTHFVRDVRKDGGSYVTEEVTVLKAEALEGLLYLGDGRKIAFTNISELEQI